jgi:hypothetical protein
MGLYSQETKMPDWIATHLNGYLDSYINADRMCFDPAGNIYLVGNMKQGTWTTDCLTLKFDPFGNEIWMRSYGDTEDSELGRAIAFDDSGFIYVAGSGSKWPGKVILLKYDSDGTLLWQRTFPGHGEGGVLGVTMEVDSNGDIVVAAIDDDFPHLLNILLKFHPDGSEAWSNVIYDDIEIDNIATDANNDICLAGWSNRASQLRKYSSVGALLWERSYSCPPYDSSFY